MKAAINLSIPVSSEHIPGSFLQFRLARMSSTRTTTGAFSRGRTERVLPHPPAELFKSTSAPSPSAPWQPSGSSLLPVYSRSRRSRFPTESPDASALIITSLMPRVWCSSSNKKETLTVVSLLGWPRALPLSLSSPCSCTLGAHNRRDCIYPRPRGCSASAHVVANEIHQRSARATFFAVLFNIGSPTALRKIIKLSQARARARAHTVTSVFGNEPAKPSAGLAAAPTAFPVVYTHHTRGTEMPGLPPPPSTRFTLPALETRASLLSQSRKRYLKKKKKPSRTSTVLRGLRL